MPRRLTGLFDLGIVRPEITREISTEGTYQLLDSHSLTYDVGVETGSRRNQNIGGFTLPERASTSESKDWNVRLQQFSALSAASLFETSFEIRNQQTETEPLSDAVQINVLDAFRSGGAQNRSHIVRRDYEFSSLYTRPGERLTVKTGVEGLYQVNQNFSEANFGGSFTFSSLGTYLAGQPVNYRVNRGDPAFDVNQFETALFLQNDVKLTPRATLMAGVRYEVQTNLSARDNIAPRVGFAYAVSQSSVLRAGAGIFHNRLSIQNVEDSKRLDGTRQFEIIVDRPSFPDPFQSGTVRNTLSSVQFLDPNLDVPSLSIVQASFERTFFRTLLLSTSYEYQSRPPRASSQLERTAARSDGASGSDPWQPLERGVVGPRDWTRLEAELPAPIQHLQRVVHVFAVARLGRRRSRQWVAPREQLRSGGRMGPESQPGSPVHCQREHAFAVGALPDKRGDGQ